MPLSGQAMLINFMNVDPDGENDFNRWYDKEHLAERVAIPGFREARRYVAEDAPQKYLGIYTTESLDVLRSPAYKERLANQTPWSRRNLDRFRDAMRACAQVGLSRGEGRGAALGFLRLRLSGANESALRETLAARAGSVLDLDGILSLHVLESDPDLSVPLTESPEAAAGASDWYVLIEATGQGALGPATAALGLGAPEDGAQLVTTARYRLLWDLAKAELSG